MEALHEVVSRLYCTGVDVPAEDFQRWGLEQIKTLVPHDVAVWGMGNAQRGRFHNVKVFGADPCFASALEETSGLNPLYPLVARGNGTPADMSDVWSDRKFYRSELYKRAFEPHGIARILSSGHADPRSGLYTLLSVYRRDRRQPFSPREKRQFAFAAYHLIASNANVFFLHLARPRSLASARVAAVVDREGVLHEVQDGFLNLLERHFPDYRGMRLPFEFEPQREDFHVHGLCVRVRPFADLYLVRIWEKTALDGLTQREREVVQAVCRGLSHKEVGRDLGLAPTTVSSHLYRAYSKLGVESRSALAKLVHGPH